MTGQLEINQILDDIHLWWNETFTSRESVLQISITLCLLVTSAFIASIIRDRLQRIDDDQGKKGFFHGLYLLLLKLLFPVAGMTVLGVYIAVSAAVGWPHELVDVVAGLLIAWSVISLATSLLGEGFLVKCIKLAVWSVYALSLLDLLQPIVGYLDGIAFSFGEARFSLYSIIKGVALFVILFRVMLTFSAFLEKRIHKTKNLTSSHKVLFSKFTRILLFLLTILIPLNAMGVDLTILTVFGGALGVGIGFGLQKVVSNFISGIILLMDRSIKPGDVIAVGNTYGWVNSLSARYVSIITRDGMEHLIPNELLITEKVENWSFSHSNVRIRIPIGVSYDADIHLARKLMLEVASKSDRILKDPEPRCLLRQFGESSVDFELRIWIADPANGMGNIQSEVLFEIWDAFKENNIEIPYPQRDLHIKSGKLSE